MRVILWNILVFNSKKASKEHKILKSLIENSTLGLATGGSPITLYTKVVSDYKAGEFQL